MSTSSFNFLRCQTIPLRLNLFSCEERGEKPNRQIRAIKEANDCEVDTKTFTHQSIVDNQTVYFGEPAVEWEDTWIRGGLRKDWAQIPGNPKMVAAWYL